MEKLFFFLTNSEAWKATRSFHENFFITHGGFSNGLLLALVVAALLGVVFYFGCANNKKDSTLATIPVWTGCLFAVGILTFLIANYVLIGKPNSTDNQSITYKYSFYKANTEYVIEQTRSNTNEQHAAELVRQKQDIENDLNKGKGVRYRFCFGCAVYGMLLYYLFSLILKGFTCQGIAIPHLWPSKNQ